MAERSWDDVVVLSDHSLGPNDPGYFALTRAADWCSYSEIITIWRGPELPDEKIATENLREVSCRTVLVNEQGFYTCVENEKPRFYRCPEVTEELEDAIIRHAEKAAEPYANEHAAEMYSYAEYEDHAQRFDREDVYVIAKFGKEIAVNGESGYSKKQVKVPKGWKKLSRSRFEGMDDEIQIEWIVDEVAHQVSRELRIRISEQVVNRTLLKRNPEGYFDWGSDYGDVEVWLSKKAYQEHEEAEERRRKREYERAMAEALLARAQAEEKRRQELEERRRLIQRGGYPHPRDWSPRGELPEEKD